MSYIINKYLLLNTNIDSWSIQVIKSCPIVSYIITYVFIVCLLNREHVHKLLDNGTAYYCFCTERRLNLLRRDAVTSQLVPKYDNRCRNLSQQEINEKLNEGKQYCIRFKVCEHG